MITLIGTSTTTIGFGLCGIQDLFEVSRKTPAEEIAKIITESKNDIILIDEDIYNNAKPLIKEGEKVIVKIPFRHKGDDDSDADIDELIKDTLGMSIKSED